MPVETLRAHAERYIETEFRDRPLICINFVNGGVRWFLTVHGDDATPGDLSRQALRSAVLYGKRTGHSAATLDRYGRELVTLWEYLHRAGLATAPEGWRELRHELELQKPIRERQRRYKIHKPKRRQLRWIHDVPQMPRQNQSASLRLLKTIDAIPPVLPAFGTITATDVARSAATVEAMRQAVRQEHGTALSAWLVLYLESANVKGHSTLKHWRQFLRRLETALGRPATVDDLTEDVLTTVAERLLSEGRGAATVTMFRAKFRALRRFAAEHRAIVRR